MTRIPPNMPPQFEQRGIAVYPARMPAQGALPPPAPSIPSPLVSLFPTLRNWNFGIAEIPINGANATQSPSIAATAAAWYGLGRIRVDVDTGNEIGFAGYDVQLLPADVNGTVTPQSGATPAAWGNSLGTLAAVVIGQNLPIEPGQWSGAPAFVPGIDGNAANTELPHNPPPYLAVIGFPTGKLTDTAPNKLRQQYMSGASLVRITRGSTLDIAIVLNRAQYEAVRVVAAARVLAAHISVILKSVPVSNQQKFGG